MAEPGETGTDETKRKANAGSFKPGDPRIRPLQEKAAREAAATQEGGADESLLDAMRYVQARPRSEDRTELQRDCRAWKAKKLTDFMAKRAELEKAALATQAEAKAADGVCPTCGQPPRDKGAQRARESLLEWLEKNKR